MNTRIQVGTLAPQFEVADVFGAQVRLRDYRGSRTMLSFYRYASCPLCNLRVHRLIQQHRALTSQGLRLIAVFHSSPKSIRQHVAQQEVPFPIVADPEKVLYNRYGVESSIKAVARAALTRLPDATMAMASGFLPGSIDGDQALVPADFVLDEGGIVRIAYYGRDIGDHLPIARIESFLRASSDIEPQHAALGAEAFASSE